MIRDSGQRTVFLTFLFIVALYVAWIGAWSLELILRNQLSWLQTLAGQTLYWTLAKAVLWVCPAIMLVRLSGRKITDVLDFGRMKAIMMWGGGIGLLLGILALAQKTIRHGPLFSSAFDSSLLSAGVISPVVEEVTFRGAVLGNLLQRYKFSTANMLTAIFFLGAHLPGWYFQGRLRHMLLSPLGGALSIFLLGWVFGFAAYRSKSTAASTLTHILNNLGNA
jgi:membrane protease YdiL (CAAX protease family)